MGDEEIHIIRPLNAYWRFIIPPVDSGAIPTLKRSVSTAVDFAVSTVFGDPARFEVGVRMLRSEVRDAEDGVQAAVGGTW
jgi:hypothetical protein